MPHITLDVWLYGSLARYGDPDATCGYANLRVRLPTGATMADLLAHLGVPDAERGITFVDGMLSAMPGLHPDLGCVLEDGMRIGIFGLKSMWPFQYRHGARVLPQLSQALQDGALRHTFT